MKLRFLGTDDPLAYLSYFIVCIVWGSTYLAIKLGIDNIPPAIFAGIRFAAVGIIMYIYARARGLRMPSTFQDLKHAAIVGLFLLTGAAGLVFWGQQHISTSLAAVLIVTSVLFTALIDSFLPQGNRVGRRGWLGLICGFMGVGILFLPELEVGNTSLHGLFGILAASLSWAIGSLYSVRKPTSSSMIPNIAVQSLIGGGALLIIGLLTGEAAHVQITPVALAALLYLIIFGSVIGYSAYIYLLKVIPPYKAVTYSYINPVVAIILGFIVLGEPINLEMALGAVVIIAGVLLVQSDRLPVPQNVSAQDTDVSG
ncbi:EamA family transporter [Desulfitibacter alkalitolerans]|uniref:EamA family transporter n=1 Tax=Desulfitibacter alkalitolerans TaxID=264641 RepID=UPI000687C94E|nr:EamA family transporter [Desulfitibacter alkalitolerans]